MQEQPQLDPVNLSTVRKGTKLRLRDGTEVFVRVIDRAMKLVSGTTQLHDRTFLWEYSGRCVDSFSVTMRRYRPRCDVTQVDIA